MTGWSGNETAAARRYRWSRDLRRENVLLRRSAAQTTGRDAAATTSAVITTRFRTGTGAAQQAQAT